jgi:propionyl-CoA carboxylase alpha chain/3-methylcrotonyl-CoA carboxylase alpha subunit
MVSKTPGATARPFSSVLVANRGEIARRVFRTASRMGLRTIAVYSDADAEAPHVRDADEAVRLGPAPARESYLDTAKVLAAAKATRAEAIHPGYGFLSENADFAEAVMAAGLVWIGPPPAAIRAMGLKDAAKKLMAEAGVPVTPGYLGDDQSPERLAREAAATGFPVLIKAVAGGGGKGMKRVDTAGEFEAALASAKREAAAAFGDDRVLIEKYVTRPRHIEVQVFGDTHGNVVHLYERDCSLQRRHQKVVEEAPAPGMDDATREAVTQAAIRAAQAVDYVGAGTVEFIADASEGLKPDRVWFMEMNTRLQVEHPVTETITGQDLVEWQLRVAMGEALPLAQAHIGITGWAMEARLYAEDPAKGFLPSIGPLDHFLLPEGEDIRVDTGVEEGGEVRQYYDPMIAKLIARGDTREEAAAALADACREVEVWPVRTNAAFLARCLEHPDFVEGEVDTGFIPARLDELTASRPSPDAFVAALALAAEDAAAGVGLPPEGDRRGPWQATPEGLYGFRLNAEPRTLHRVEVEGAAVEGGARPLASGEWRWLVEHEGRYEEALVFNEQVVVGERRALSFVRSETGVVLFDEGQALEIRESEIAGHAGDAGAVSDGSIRAPMPGKIVAVQAAAGDTVEKGRPLVVLEAMKMEHALTAPFDGVVESLPVSVGQQVTEGAILAKVTKGE